MAILHSMTIPSLPGIAGKKALVTGGSRGIGAATVRLLAACGADVAIGYRSRAKDAESVAARARENGVAAHSIGADISTLSGADDLVSRAVESLGGLDIFVGNAGVWPAREVPVASMDVGQWASTLRENLDSVFYTTRAVANAISDGGRIVLVSSTAGQRGEAFHADYAATKGAVISYTKSLAIELASRGITVNSVAPGWVDTEMVAPAVADSGADRIAAGIPLGRIASADDIAGPIVFLCSALARHVTGEILNVNGGSVLSG
jgi:3-oxoacyl-[acyl-carrier protein] reductase